MSEKPLDKQIVQLGEKNSVEQLQALIATTSVSNITAVLNAKLGRNECITFWNYLLQGFDASSHDAKEKRFACVKAFLNGLQKVELSYKQTYDLVTRLCQDLSTFSSEHLVEILEHCLDALRMGDPKCVSWKDLLPEALKVLAAQPQLSVNGIAMTGAEYRNTTVRNLYTMRWPTAVLTPIADMFKELQLNASETTTVLNKFAAALQTLTPAELPALSYQLFTMCSTAAQIFVPILALEKYFYRYYYKKLFEEMLSNSTDFDSIDAYTDKELREAEETILHHLNYCTQYKISELQLAIALKNFQCMPDVILTPFVLSAILSMTAANREPDTRLATSVLLTFLRSVFKSNEDERALADYSVWCRDSLQRQQVDLDQVFTVLIDQNKDGKDVITPGLVNLAFALLKAKHSPALNTIAMGFLTRFIRRRFVFGQGIVKRIAEWMIVEQEQYQYGECLTMLSVADTFTVSECVKTINYVMDFFGRIPGEQAMRMMSFILPILKLSAIVRDRFIEVLRKAMNSCEMPTRQMAVYGFCMILKQLNNSNSQRSQLGFSGTCTQQSISGFSLMSQATLGQRSNPQRHFDMLTLEIIGLLRNCFNEALPIKCTLYENLQRSVELNPKLVPHVLQFIDWHFHSYFEMPQNADDDTQFSVHFKRIVHAPLDREHEIEVSDNLGRLVLFVAHCLVIFEKCEGDYDTREMKRLLTVSIERVIAKELKFEDAGGGLTHIKLEMFTQQLNFIEGLMAYVLLTSKQTNEHVKHLLPLFKVHSRLTEELKLATKSGKKLHKKVKNATDDSLTQAANTTINGVVVGKKLDKQVDNIWDLIVVERFMRLLHEDVVNFALDRNTSALRSNCELVRYVLQVTAAKIEGIRLEPEYKQLPHSKRTLRHLTDITKVVYERCIKRLPELWRDFDLKTAALAAECFRQCLQTANAVYKRKFRDVFLKGFDFHVINNCKEAPAVLQDVIDEYMLEDATASAEESLSKDVDGCRIPIELLQSLEVLYDNISYGNRMTTESYTWLLKFCKGFELHTKDMGLVHKLLFVQRQKTHSGAFFNVIAKHLGDVLGAVTDRDDEPMEHCTQMDFKLKSITLSSAESCLQHLYGTLRKQIEDVDYFILKANNINYKYRMLAEEDREMCVASLRALERSICTQLVHISNALLELTNVCIPLGGCMDSLLRLVMQHYICLKNLAKHLLCCCAVMSVSIQNTRFDALLHIVGKRLPSNIYSLITYIEANIFDEPAKKSARPNPQAEKAKVLRETKLIPKIILCVENFNKHVILLAKKTNERLANLLHYGVVRDFRIKTSELKAAIERTLSHSSQIEAVPSEIAADDEDVVMGDEDSNEQPDGQEAASTDADEAETDADEAVTDEQPQPSRSLRRRDTKSSTSAAATTKKRTHKKKNTKVLSGDEQEDLSTPENENILEETSGQILDNLEQINKKAKKRMLRESENNDPDVASAQPLPKKRRGRSTKT